MRQRRSYSFPASISAVVVALTSTIALMAMVIDGSIQKTLPGSNAPTTGQNDVETSLHRSSPPANYSKWGDNASSTGSDNGSSASTLTENGSSSSADNDGQGATMSTPGVSGATANKLSRTEGERVSTSLPIQFAEYGIDVREELRTDEADGDEDDTENSQSDLELRLEVSNLINANQGEPPSEDGDGRSSSAVTFATSFTSTPTSSSVNHSTGTVVVMENVSPADTVRNRSRSRTSEEYLSGSRNYHNSNDSRDSSGSTINNKLAFKGGDGSEGVEAEQSPSSSSSSASSFSSSSMGLNFEPISSTDLLITTPSTTTIRELITPPTTTTTTTSPTTTTPESRRSHIRQYSSKKYHDHHWGPFFEDPHLNRKTPNAAKPDSPVQVGIHLGAEAFFNCRVGMLRDKTVMWVRKTSDKVMLLTVGNNTYSGDSRISIRFQYPNNWRLQINPVQADDAGLYMCQVSTHPPRVFATNVTILAPAIRVVDEHGHEVHDRYYKMGSAIDLTCQIATSFLAVQPSVAPPPGNVHLNIPKATTSSTLSATTRGPLPVFPQIPLPNAIHTFNSYNNNQNSKNADEIGVVGAMQANKREHHYDYLHQRLLWQKDNGPLPKDVQVNLSATPEWRNNRISIEVADRTHSGTYSCSLLNTTTVVNVQVLNALLPGEMPAAVQHNAGGRPAAVPVFGQSPMPIILVLLFYRFLLSAHIC